VEGRESERASEREKTHMYVSPGELENCGT